MFPDTAGLAVDPDHLEQAGQAGGVCESAEGPEAGGDDAAEAAGWPFFGQFIAHDITADRSPVGPRADVEALRNARSPKLNLELLYGDGPVGAPYLFDAADPARLLTDAGGADVPRNRQGTALIGDPRNDSHLFVNRLHLAFLHAHNAIVRQARAGDIPASPGGSTSAGGTAEDVVYPAARQALTWHYQWIAVHDYLPRLVGPELVDEVLAAGGRYFAPGIGAGFLPLEFADAAFRYGHGQIRHSYRLTAAGPPVPLFPDLVGFAPVGPAHDLDFGQLFDLPGRPPAQRAKRLDGGLPASLIGLPHQVTGDLTRPAYRSLAVRDLMRGDATCLPAGEAVADLFGVARLSVDEVGGEWAGGTPLWFYILKEAQWRGGGDRLGPVGGRIVAEVLIGLIRADPDGYLGQSPQWTPTLGTAGRFGLADLIALANGERALG